MAETGSDARAVQAAGAPARAADAPPPTTSVALADLDGRTAYRLLTGLVAPRPIAWVSTLSPAGVPNLAPFSFFTLLTGRPPTVMFAAGDRPGGEAKDTLANALATGEFVVNLADRQLAEAVNATSAMVAPDVDEFALAGLATAPSVEVAPPRVAAAPAALEARVSQVVPVEGSPATMVLGHVLRVHVRTDLLAADGLVDAERFGPVARLGRDEYAALGEVFRLRRPSKRAGTAEPRGRLEQPARAFAEARPLVLEQPALALHAGGVAREPAVGGDDAVARHHHRQPVGAVGLSHGPHRLGVAQALREPQVGERPTRGDAPQLAPHAELEGAARQRQGRGELAPPPAEVVDQ